MATLPQIDGTLVRTLADWAKFYKDNGQAYDIIELLDQENSILDDILWREATDKDGNRTALRVSLPAVYWRQLYKGIPVSKSDVATVKDPVGMLEARSVIDAKLLQLHASQANSYRMQEAKAFMESMRQELSTAVFYGNVKNKPEGIHGLAPRYAYKNGPNVVDAGGVTGNMTSIWGVIWGDNESSGIFPKDSKMGLDHEILPRFDAYDALNNAYRAEGDLFQWNVGLSVRDWRCVVRVANIPVANLFLKKTDAGFIDLHRLTIMAKNKIPPAKRMRMVWYMNQDVMTATELQASDAGHVTLVYRAEDARSGGPLFRSYPLPLLHGAPIRQDDAIISIEEVLPTAP